jgi:alpha-amylase
LLIESDQQNIYIDVWRGGAIFEWDFLRATHNVLSVVARREESYHQTLREHERERRKQAAAVQMVQDGQIYNPHTTVRTKEPDLDRLLVVDRTRRYSLLDHFLAPYVALETYAEDGYEDQGDFADQPYEVTALQEEPGITATAIRHGQVRRSGALTPLPVTVQKTLTLPVEQEELRVHYIITNQSEARLESRFACEWNLHLLGGGGNDQAYYAIPNIELENSHFDSTGEVPNVSVLHIGNTWLKLDLGFTISQPATLWRYSIDTVTGSEAGFERNHQGSCLTLVWPLVLNPGASWEVMMTCAGSAQYPQAP